MLLSRRRALLGVLAAPAIIRNPGILMPIRAIKPDMEILGVTLWDTPMYPHAERCATMEIDVFDWEDQVKSAEQWLEETMQAEVRKLLGIPRSLLA